MLQRLFAAGAVAFLLIGAPLVAWLAGEDEIDGGCWIDPMGVCRAGSVDEEIEGGCWVDPHG
jgi:hypothetical protein